jgi:tocopherol O-methyltransferase
MPSNKEIVDYYDFSTLDYQIYNGSLTDLSMHFGLWDETTATHREALKNENRVVAQLLGITARDRVLDLGCGYGSSAVWLAEHIGCHVTGITLSAKQVAIARQLAKSHGVAHRTYFMPMDFHKLAFPPERFTAAFAIESICHSSDKNAVLRETLRVLKPGGRLAVADGYLGKKRNLLTPEEETIAKTCFDGVHIPPLLERTAFQALLAETGFDQIIWINKTSAILRTSRRTHQLAKYLLLPLSGIFRLLRRRALQVAHARAFVEQYNAFRGGLGLYGIFLATKPLNGARKMKG